MAAEEAPIAAVRVAPAAPVEAVAAAAPAPVAAAAVEPAPAAVVAEAAAAAPIELVSERPSLLETLGDKPKPEVIKPEAASDKPKPDAVKPAAEAKPAADVKPDAKPGEAKVDAAKPDDAAKPEPQAAIEYKYELPPTLKMDDALKTEVHTAFDAFRANPAEGAQGLIDLHNKVVTDLSTQLAADTLRNQHKTFNDTRSQWNKDWLADPEIGGAGYQTATRAIARMRDQFVSDEAPGTPKYQADLKAFDDFLRVTGAGDHPAFGRFLHNVARIFDEPAPPPPNTKPAPGNNRPPGRRQDAMYTHPSSQKAS